MINDPSCLSSVTSSFLTSLFLFLCLVDRTSTEICSTPKALRWKVKVPFRDENEVYFFDLALLTKVDNKKPKPKPKIKRKTRIGIVTTCLISWAKSPLKSGSLFNWLLLGPRPTKLFTGVSTNETISIIKGSYFPTGERRYVMSHPRLCQVSRSESPSTSVTRLWLYLF